MDDRTALWNGTSARGRYNDDNRGPVSLKIPEAARRFVFS
jgi:hypothetical protein